MWLWVSVPEGRDMKRPPSGCSLSFGLPAVPHATPHPQTHTYYIYIIYNRGPSHPARPLSSFILGDRAPEFLVSVQMGVGRCLPGTSLLGVQGKGEVRVMGNGVIMGPALPPCGRSTGTERATTQAGRSLLGTRGRRPTGGRAIGHWRWLPGLGTLVCGEP